MVKLRLAPEGGQEETDLLADPGGFPAVYPSIQTVLKESRWMEGALRASGVRDGDVPDMLQNVMVAAWEAIGEGRYRPDPSREPSAVLRAWLGGILWRQSTHYRQGASYGGQETLVDPQPLLDEQARRDPHGLLLARDALQAIALLAPYDRSILWAIANGQTVADYAKEQGMERNTVRTRLRHARGELREYLAGRGWRRRRR